MSIAKATKTHWTIRQLARNVVALRDPEKRQSAAVNGLRTNSPAARKEAGALRSLSKDVMGDGDGAAFERNSVARRSSRLGLIGALSVVKFAAAGIEEANPLVCHVASEVVIAAVAMVAVNRERVV
jgi:hypothetical protein